MQVERVRVSDTVTRYLVTVRLDPGTRLLLIRPEDRLIIASWQAGGTGRMLRAEWVSPYPDLEAVVEDADGQVHPSPACDIAS